MALKLISSARHPLRALQRVGSISHASSATRLPLLRSLFKGAKKSDYLPPWVTHASLDEDAPSEPAPDPAAPPPAATSFLDLGIDERLATGLENSGIVSPTAVQSAAIPEILSGSNVAVQCYTGSGKTLAFLLPVLSMAVQRAEQEWEGVTRKTRGEAGAVQAIVVTPSRELAMQIVRVAQSLLPDSARNAVQQAIGGANMARQREALRFNKPLLVVGTPGRLAELSRDGALQSHRCKILVMDEVDQLLAPQFREEMARITEHTGRRAEGGRQTIVVSATLTTQVLSLCGVWCPSPRKVFVGADGVASTAPSTGPIPEDPAAAAAAAAASGAGPSWGWGVPGSTYAPEFNTPGTGSAGGYGNRDTAPSIAPGLTHLYVNTPPQHRVDTLRRAIHAVDAQRALVFMNFQQRLKDAEVKLAARRMAVASLHGEMSKQERAATLAAFRAGKFRALLVSDVAARGLDVPECDAVFNLELPTDAAHYAHRAGRTGRAGREGVVVTLAAGLKEHSVVDRLGRTLGVEFMEVKLEKGELTMADRDYSVGEVDSSRERSRSRGGKRAVVDVDEEGLDWFEAEEGGGDKEDLLEEDGEFGEREQAPRGEGRGRGGGRGGRGGAGGGGGRRGAPPRQRTYQR